MLKIVILSLALVACTLSSLTPTETYPHTATLKSDAFIIYWKFNTTHITLEAHGHTTGWVGIGFSPNGAMTNADMVVGWVKGTDVKVTDRYGVSTGNAFPPKDPGQEVAVDAGKECDGWTYVKFTRQLAACETTYDRHITSDTTRLIWAYGSEDPAGDDITAEDYHNGNRGVKSLYLLESTSNGAGRPWVPDNKTHEFLSSSFRVPATDTYYNCILFKMPEVTQKHHIIQFEPVITPEYLANVHHMILYQCSDTIEDEREVGVNAECYGPAMSYMPSCTSLVVAWAIGGSAIYLPEHAGISFGSGAGSGDPIYVQLEIHYDNPERLSNIVDSSGFRIAYTPTLRANDVGILQIGNQVDPFQHYIPPGAESYLSVGFCAGTCLSTAMQEANVDSITIFGVTLHSHLAGKKLKLRHFRDGEELPFLLSDDSYDFNYQDARFLDPVIEFKSGDVMRMECEYNTEGRTQMTTGGLGTTEEMCLGFVLYYKRLNVGRCETVAEISVLDFFGIEDVRYSSDYSLEGFEVTAPEALAGKTVLEVMNEFDWTESKVDEFSLLYSSARQQQICDKVDHKISTFVTFDAPEIKSAYSVPTKTCTQSASDLTQSTRVTTCDGVFNAPSTLLLFVVTAKSFVELAFY